MPAALSTIDLLDRLVSFDTTSTNTNLPLVDFICEYVEPAGVTIETLPAPDQDKASLLIRRGPPGVDRSGLMLSGHMDVVPATEAGWRSNPFQTMTRDDRLIGRGTCDMKGFLAIAVNALMNAAELKNPLVLLLTYDEELGTLGSRHFVDTYPSSSTLPRRTIIGEPTALSPVRMHKGHVKIKISISGQSSHSGLPHLGINAIEPAARAVTALSTLRAELERERPAHHNNFPDVPYAALNVAMITGGRAINVVPDECVIDVGIRTLPEMETDTIVGRVHDGLVSALGPDGFEMRLEGDSPPMLLDANADLLESFHPHHDHGASFATDAGWLQRIGCECVLWGPGDMKNAHRPNEYLLRSDLARCEEELQQIIHRWCGPS